MLPFTPILLLWIPVSAFFFAYFRPVKAVALAYLIGWLLLPAGEVPVRGFWDINKEIATNFGVWLGMFLFCPRQIYFFRLQFADLLVLLYCFASFVASVDNDLGYYDGISRFCYQFFFYGAPFIAGRIFVRTREDLVEVAKLVALASAIYALLALWEWRMSPKFATTFFNIPFEHSWSQHRRWGFFRPILMFPHALGLGMYFCWTALLSIWLYIGGGLPRIVPVPMWLMTFGPLLLPLPTLQLESDQLFLAVMIGSVVWAGIMAFWVGRWVEATRTLNLRMWFVAGGPLIGLVTCMSIGPYGLFVMGASLLIIWAMFRCRWLIVVPICFVMFWMGARYTGAITGQWLIDTVEQTTHHSRTLAYRIEAENLILEHVHQQPAFGWGTWGRNRIKDDKGNNAVAIDGLWLNVVSTTGLFGLITFFLWWWWPIVMFLTGRDVLSQQPVLQAIMVIITLQSVNFLFNGFLDPVVTLMSGSVVTILSSESLRRVAPRFTRPEPATIPSRPELASV